jgi:hypothetical protein
MVVDHRYPGPIDQSRSECAMALWNGILPISDPVNQNDDRITRFPAPIQMFADVLNQVCTDRSASRAMPGVSSRAAHSGGMPLLGQPTANTVIRPRSGRSSTAGCQASWALRPAPAVIESRQRVAPEVDNKVGGTPDRPPRRRQRAIIGADRRQGSKVSGGLGEWRIWSMPIQS